MDDTFVQNIISFRGDTGRKWLDDIPNKIKTYEKKWKITVLPPFTLSYNYVAPAKLEDGTSVVLKIGFPNDKEFLSEITALILFNGEGTEKLLQEDANNAVILLERVFPGQTLDQLNNDEEEVRIACKLLKKLWRKAPKNDTLLQLNSWHNGNGFQKVREKYNGTTGPLPEPLLTRAETLFLQLLKTTKEPQLLHGDFHHSNILSSERNGWLAIDPKGIIGDPCYDIGIFLNNPQAKLLKRIPVKETLAKRITIFSEELGIDKGRITQWGIIMATLSAVWSALDHNKGYEYGIQVAELLSVVAS